MRAGIKAPSPPPVPKKVPHETRLHGRVLSDPFFWMRERSDPDVLAYLKAENAYTEAVMAPTRRLQTALYREMVGRIKETDRTVPVPLDDFFYFSRTRKGKQYPIYCRRKGFLRAPAEILLDVNRLAKGHPYLDLGVFSVSPDHRLLAYATDTDGSESYTLCVKDLATGELLPDRIINCGTTAVWAEDRATLFYVVLDPAKRPYRLFRHRLGTDPAQDVLIYEEADEAFFLAVHKTKSRRFLLLDSHSKTTSEVRYANAAKPEDLWKAVHPREQGVEYSVEHHGGRFLILTNDGAVNFKLMETPLAETGKGSWREVIGHRPDVKIDGMEAFSEYLVVYEREKGLKHIRVTRLEDGAAHRIVFPEPVYTAWGGQNPEFKTPVLRFGYSSLVTPASVYDYRMDTRRRKLRKQQKVLGGYNPDRYASERVEAVSHDGVRVPISLVYRRDLRRRGGRAPLLLYGYGAYGISTNPEFSSTRLSLLDRGVICALAHVRGGGDLGRPWYDDGKMLRKKNTFFDFIACADHLVKEKYTSAGRLAIYGGSAGGLLIGAVLNERPDLFHAAVAKVPFVDVLNTMLDGSLPLTVTEYEEWGNPRGKPYFEYIHSYSPYDNVRPQAYPHVLITSGLNDPRVQYWEPAKWTARLREMNTGNHVVLLKMAMGSGHGGSSGRYEYLKEIAFDYAFILGRLGLSLRS